MGSSAKTLMFLLKKLFHMLLLVSLCFNETIKQEAVAPALVVVAETKKNWLELLSRSCFHVGSLMFNES